MSLMKRAPSTIHRLAAVCCLVLAVCGSALAETARATLSNSTTSVGEAVELTIDLSGLSGTILASNNPSVDGLSISGPEISQQFQSSSGAGVQSSSSLVYSIQPERKGTFTIPGLHFRANGREFDTEPVVLKVEDQKTDASGNPQGAGYWAWAEISLPKETAYVGEMLPLEIHLFVDATAQPRLEQMPTLEGEGFTVTKLTEPRVDQVQRDGRTYDRFTSEAAISPSQAGKIEVGKAECPYVGIPPRAKAKRPHSPFGQFFGDDFFNDPFGHFVQPERHSADAPPVELMVKPLPAQGRPASFSGAVGAFTFSGEGSPAKVGIGDPITMKLKVTGAGNFDRVSAPVLKDSTGWRAYPPTSNFKAEDQSGFRGAKTFEVAVIPEAKKQQMPVFEFSYFDPAAEKYVTAASKAAPLEVTGEALAAAQAGRAAASAGQPGFAPASAGPCPDGYPRHRLRIWSGALFVSALFAARLPARANLPGRHPGSGPAASPAQTEAGCRAHRRAAAGTRQPARPAAPRREPRRLLRFGGPGSANRCRARHRPAPARHRLRRRLPGPPGQR